MGDVKLPSLPTSIENMTRDSLRVFIPQMLRAAERRDNLDFGCIQSRPMWWPVYTPWAPLRIDTRDVHSKNRISWTEELRNVVRCCYRFYNVEHLLHEAAPGTDPAPGTEDDVSRQIDVLAHSKFNGKVPASLEAKIPVTPLPLCEVALSPLPKYYTPPGDVPDCEAAAPQPRSTAAPLVRTSARLERKREDEVLEIFLCQHCNNEFRSPTALQRHLTVCAKCPDNHLPPRPFKIPPRPTSQVEQIHVDLMPRARKVDLTERLGLLPLSKAKVVRKQRSRVKDIKITRLDDNSEKDTAVLKSPPTPRTAKSLMSQLSRDFSPPIKTRRKSLFAACESVDDTDIALARPTEVSDTESTSSKSSEKVAESDGYKDPWNKEKRASILSIDFASPLGVRVTDLMNQQAEKIRVYSEEPTTNYEDFCHTPKKTEMIRRLRDRKDMVTFKKNRRSCPKWAHSYKFTKSERLEWYRTNRTGLNARSRPLLKLIKNCHVKITRVRKEVIKKWGIRKPRPMMNALSPQALQNMLRQRQLVPQGASPELQRMLLAAKGGQVGFVPMGADQQKRLLMNSVLNEMRPGGNRLMPSILRKPQSVLRSPMSGSYPVPSGVYANSSTRNPQMPPLSQNTQNLARKVAQNVVRNLSNQLNFAQPNSYRMQNGRFGKSSQTDMNHNKQAVKRAKTTTSNPIVIEDEDDDVVAVSSSDASSSPPQKRRKIESAPALLFKCHLCGEELTCAGSFARYVEQHFADRHNVHTIQLIEHIDQNGQKVVSIVEKQAKQPQTGPMQTENRASNKGPANVQRSDTNQGLAHKKSNTQLERVSSTKSRHNTRSASISPRSSSKPSTPLTSSSNRSLLRNSNSAKRGPERSQNENSSPAAVICID